MKLIFENQRQSLTIKELTNTFFMLKDILLKFQKKRENIQLKDGKRNLTVQNLEAC